MENIISHDEFVGNYLQFPVLVLFAHPCDLHSVTGLEFEFLALQVPNRAKVNVHPPLSLGIHHHCHARMHAVF